MSVKRVPVLGVFLLLALAVVPIAFKAKAQVALFPLVVYLLMRFEIFSRHLPRALFVLAILGFVLSIIAHFSHVSLKPGFFLVASVSDSDFYHEAKIYRDRLRHLLGRNGKSLVGVHAGVISGKEDADLMLYSSKSLGGIVWGTNRWINVALQTRAPLSLGGFPKDSAARDVLVTYNLSDLLLAYHVPYLGMSHSHERGTLSFIARLIKVLQSMDQRGAGGVELVELEPDLRAMAHSQARWTSRAHLAVPLWLVGTMHLVRAIEGVRIDEGELNCAIEDFKDALSQFKVKDNPALQVVVLNNLGVALIIKSQLEGASHKLRSAGIRQISKAAKLRKKGIEQSSIAIHNYHMLITGKRRRDYGG